MTLNSLHTGRGEARRPALLMACLACFFRSLRRFLARWASLGTAVACSACAVHARSSDVTGLRRRRAAPRRAAVFVLPASQVSCAASPQQRQPRLVRWLLSSTSRFCLQSLLLVLCYRASPPTSRRMPRVKFRRLLQTSSSLDRARQRAGSGKRSHKANPSRSRDGGRAAVAVAVGLPQLVFRQRSHRPPEACSGQGRGWVAFARR